MVDLTDPTSTIAVLVRASATEVQAALRELATPPGEAPNDVQLLVRAAAYGRCYDLDRDPATLALALADYDRSSAYGLHRDLVTRYLVLAQAKAAAQGQAVEMGRLSAMLDLPDDPAAPGTLAALQGLVLVAGALVDAPGYDVDDALGRVDKLIAASPANPELAAALPTFRQALLVNRAQRTGSYGAAAEAARYAEKLSASFDPNSVQWLRTELMRLGGVAMAAAQRGDVEAAMRVVPQLESLVDQLPLDDPAARQLRVAVSQLKALAGGPVGPLPADAGDPDSSRGERAARLFLAGMAECNQAGERQGVALLETGVMHLRQAVDLAAEDDPQRCAYLATLGRMECTLFQLVRRRADLDSALRHLDTAVRLAEHPAHPLWSPATSALALACRLDGRLAQGRSWGLRSLRGNTWAVLLQERPEHATDAARHAASDVVEVARWCIADGDAAGAAVALDAGRGLMLTATRVTASVPERLTDLGQSDLADEWRRNGGDDNPATGPNLRYRVLSVLAGRRADASTLADHRVLDPPSLDEVRAALTAVDVDALVYLVPGDASGEGAAILVPRHEAPYHVPLSELTERGGPVLRYASALASRDLAPVPDGSGSTARLRTALDELCAWAWSAAMAKVLNEVSQWRLDRTPRLVLVPMGELATVPWHAAYSADGRFAVQDAVFSYAPSARMLCDCAWRTAAADDSGSLIVGDPTGDLPDARTEAVAVRDAYYPSAVLLGAEDDADGLPPATPTAVLDWLGAADTECGLLHLACHGALRPGGGHGSYLSLAGGAELSAQTLLEAEQLSRPVDRISWSALEVDRDLVVSNTFVPPGQCTAGGVLDDGLLRVLAGEGAHIVHAGEERDGGEHFFFTVVAT